MRLRSEDGTGLDGLAEIITMGDRLIDDERLCLCRTGSEFKKRQVCGSLARPCTDSMDPKRF